MDPGQEEAAAPRERLTVVGRLMLGLIALLLAVALVRRWLAVDLHTPLRGWAALDFLRLNLSYYLALLLFGYLALKSRRLVWPSRLLIVLLTAHLIAADLLTSILIAYTGALVPTDAAYYMAWSIGTLPMSIRSTELVTLAAIPALALLVAFYYWRQVYDAPGQRRQAQIIAAAAAALLAAALLPPLSPRLELNMARPAYLYHVIENLAKATWLQVPAASPDEAPVPTRKPVPADSPTEAVPTLRKQVPADSPDRAAQVSRGSNTPNLVIVALESVGASATSLYNPELPQATPFLAALGATSWVAAQAYAVAPHTSKALVAINCGQVPYPRHPIFESTFGIPGPCLAELLGKRGYATAFFQSPDGKFENRAALVRQMGFDHLVSGEMLDPAGFQLANHLGYEDDILLAPSRRWLEQQKQLNRPFFGFYMTGSTHHPYWPADRYGYLSFDPRDGEHDRYLNAVRYLDHFVKNLIAQYRQVGLYDNTVFVIVGDHGESFGQHSRRQHNASLYQEVMHIPLLIHAPGLLAPARPTELVSQVDLLPSLLSLLGSGPAAGAEGFAHFPPAGSRGAVPMFCWYEFWCAGTVEDGHKFIANFGQKPDELYDLRQDPRETVNLAARNPERVAELRRRVHGQYEADVRRWESYFRAQDEDFWQRREESLGEPVVLLGLAPDDRRLGKARR
jgi:phosphoglycerol transferase MdoB-like AlkP superfamily enzyme